MKTKEKDIFIVKGKYPHSKPIKGNPTLLLQAQALGFLKLGEKLVPVIDIHETEKGFQIEIG